MPDDILVINAGSSSIKTSLFEMRGDGPALRVAGQIEGIATRPHFRLHDAAGKTLYENRWTADGPRNHGEALQLLIRELTKENPKWRPTAIGHRIVHGGTKFVKPVTIDEEVLTQLRALVPLAPLHQPANILGIELASKAFPGVPQVAAFDTAFHHAKPLVADEYALPAEFYQRGMRRYGFHGLSYAYIVRAMRTISPAVAEGRMIVAHLGNGASLCAIRDGKCVETTMGFTPLDGVPMGTRCGQIDPGVLLYLMDQHKMDTIALTDLLYHRSGLLGLSGVSSDMRDLLASQLPAARAAIDYFVHHVACAIGSLGVSLGGVDGIVFTAGIGEHSPQIRTAICEKLSWLGVQLDEKANQSGRQCITAPSSNVSAWAVSTDEERMIALYVRDVMEAPATA